MSYTDTRDEIYNQLSAVTGIGKLYKSRRNSTDWTTFLSLYKDSNNKINVGWFWLDSATEQDGGSKVGSENSDEESLVSERWEIWKIELYYGFEDADDANNPSEFAFQTLLENVEAKFRFLDDLNGKASRSNALQRTYSGAWQFLNSEVLCHKVEWTLRVRQRIINT